MAANSQQFGTNRSDHAPRRGNEVNVSSLEQQLIELTNFMRQMAIGNGKTVRACGVCAKVGHETDMCPTLQEGSAEQVGRIISISDTETLRYNNRTIKLIGHRILHNHNVLKFQRLETRASIQHLNTQVGQLATTINRLEAQNSSSLPSQTVVNPKENVSAITLRSGRELKVHEEEVQTPIKNEHEEKSEDEGIKGLYEVFRRCEVNIPLLDAIKQVSTVIQRKIPTKCKDPGPLTETAIVIQMADRSTIHPRGVLEDVLVQVDKLVFPADFYVLDMKNNDMNSPILLGRPFLKTSKFIIDVNNGTLTMEFDGEIVKIHIFDTLKIPGCESVVNNIDINDHLSQEHKTFVKKSNLKEVIAQPAKNSIAEIFLSDLQVPKTEPKPPPDRAKGMSKKKGRNHQETGIGNKSKKSKERKNGQKITGKLFKWVKVDKETRYEPQ
ncbi:uncharacterized protein [Henckelia pumila]|uniref:uncharacterized protein n=1 Tax=Henckelia pumila TaxID=405737 RepID=UPI003C6E7052